MIAFDCIYWLSVNGLTMPYAIWLICFRFMKRSPTFHLQGCGKSAGLPVPILVHWSQFQVLHWWRGRFVHLREAQHDCTQLCPHVYLCLLLLRYKRCLPALVENVALFSVWRSKVHLNLHLLACVNKCCTGNASTPFVTTMHHVFTKSMVCPCYVVTPNACRLRCFIPSMSLPVLLGCWPALL